jgi:hypothetical protein
LSIFCLNTCHVRKLTSSPDHLWVINWVNACSGLFPPAQSTLLLHPFIPSPLVIWLLILLLSPGPRGPLGFTQEGASSVPQLEDAPASSEGTPRPEAASAFSVLTQSVICFHNWFLKKP